MNEPIISVSGLRGIVGDTLTPEVAMRYAAAFATTLPPGPVVVGRDGRASGLMLLQAISAALEAAGRDVLDAQFAATPTIGVLVQQYKAAGGIQISASHNPPAYNGIKLFNHVGRVIPAAAGKTVIDRYSDGHREYVAHDRLGKREPILDTTSEHLTRVLKLVDVSAIRARRFRVVIDSNHGAGSVLGLRLLDELGCQVIAHGATPDGQFEHTPEPTAENLAAMLEQIPHEQADVGFCQDPDADRLALVDETGRYVGEEYTLAICVQHELSRRPGPVVTNCSTSRMSQDLAERFGVPFHRSSVGEANVVDAMLAHGAVIGGEGNGGCIDPQVVLVRDSMIGMARVLDSLVQQSLPLSKLVDTLPRYAMVKTKFALAADRVPAAIAVMKNRFAGAEFDELDGLRVDWPGKWLLFRASNTEPIVRVMAEAKTEAEAREVCDAAGEILGG